MSGRFTEEVLAARRRLTRGLDTSVRPRSAEEGGCGVVGYAATVPLAGRYLQEPARRMHNRGNGKGGGVAAAGFSPDQLGIDDKTLKNAYLLQVALLDDTAEDDVEKEAIRPRLDILHKVRVEPAMDYRDLGLDQRPPNVIRYVVQAAELELRRFAREHRLTRAPTRVAEDELIFQNTFRLNQRFYASLGDKRAFVLSHGRDLMIFKIVGYAEQVVAYYGLDDLGARVWIAHQRFPTRGRVWHPAGSHPFSGMNEALVHNGDLANYHSVTEYLRQHHVVPQFLTDTEVAVLLFDLWHRIYGYPTEALIEALAPTTDLDFERLDPERQRTYRALSAMHINGSPDGPWFFIIAASDPDRDRYRLLGITDTAMLRPQVFALQRGPESIGLVASEKQAIDNTLAVLSAGDSRFRPVADRYWSARGGSYTDGGAFTFDLIPGDEGYELRCSDKFGRPVEAPTGDLPEGFFAAAPVNGEAVIGPLRRPGDGGDAEADGGDAEGDGGDAEGDGGDAEAGFAAVRSALPGWTAAEVRWVVKEVEGLAAGGDAGRDLALGVLTRLNDRRFDCGDLRRAVVLELVRAAICRLLDRVPGLDAPAESTWRRVDRDSKETLRAPVDGETTLVICAAGFPPEGDHCDARLAVRAHELGWRRFVVYGLTGQRFTGCGFGASTGGVRMDVYGSPGDYLGSGLDGMRLHVHASGQDQLAQIIQRGELVVHGDVGQAFGYGGKGGDIFVLGSAGGRPLINAVGRPRVVINGTCLDYLAESFMAGDPHAGGGFVILNSVAFDDAGEVRPLQTPYPGSNLFSLASGGALYVRDPARHLVDAQLNGGVFAEVEPRDWALIEPTLRRNEELFGIAVDRDLLTVDGERLPPDQVYRKVVPRQPPDLARQTVPDCAQGTGD